MVQWLAASECAREVDYHISYEVKERRFIQRLRDFTEKLMKENICVGQLWDAMQDLGDYDVKAGTVFESVLEMVKTWKEQELVSQDGHDSVHQSTAGSTRRGSSSGQRQSGSLGRRPSESSRCVSSWPYSPSPPLQQMIMS